MFNASLFVYLGFMKRANSSVYLLSYLYSVAWAGKALLELGQVGKKRKKWQHSIISSQLLLRKTSDY
jgi:hypothetical protein